LFGQTVAIDLDGTRIAVGAPGSSANRGVIYLYDAKKISGGKVIRNSLLIEDPTGQSGDQLGASLAVTPTRVISGAPGVSGNKGAMYVFYTKIVQPPTVIANPKGKPDNNFGDSIAVCDDSTTILVGASGYDENQGGAYLFSGLGDTPVVVDAPVVIQYEPYSPVGDFEFGYAVACGSGKAVIGARNKGDDKEGDAFLYST